MFSYLVIESKSSSIDKINSVIEQYPEFKNVGNSNNYKNALEIILKEYPKLVFVNLDGDIKKPFKLIKEVTEYLDDQPVFIGISSSKKKAYTALKNNFFDYLITPLTELDIRKVALRFKKKHFTKLTKKICLKSYKDYQYFNTEDILFLKADNNTTDFHMSDGRTICAYKTLKTYGAILPSNFLRIHKSYIINNKYVTRVNYGKRNCSLDKLEKKIPFTKTYINTIDTLQKQLASSSLLGLN